MGSRALERSGHLVIAYDARGHGESGPAPDRDYSYERLAGDLEAVLDACGVERAVLAGASMGAHTAARFALEHPRRVGGLVLITPAYDPDAFGSAAELTRWDRLARGLRQGGVEGFLAAYPLTELPERIRPTVEQVLRQRLSAHRHPQAVADALESVPRSRPFARLQELSALAVPALVVASRDEPDPGHPLAVGEAWARAIPGASLVVEDPPPPPASSSSSGESRSHSPIAWQGGQLSRLIAEVAASVDGRAHRRT
jgi:pimeloyl-ACP methyl ester carboxylesterase